MKKVLIVILLVWGYTLSAQTSFLSGQVVDAQNEAVEFADVVLYNPLDTQVVQAAITDANGVFRFQTAPGNYLLQIRIISFEEVWRPVLLKPGRNPQGDIVLGSDQELLEEVVVKGEQNQMELKLDKRVFNVAKDLSNAGGTASDILETLPSVTMDMEGNVALRGSENVRILINGKPSALLGSDNSGLRQLQASMIERVEIITNPSARYEAEGEAGIINIVLKKQTKAGTNGSIDLNAGFPLSGGVGLNLNHRRDRFNIYTNLSANYRNSPGQGSARTEIYGQDTLSFDTDREHVRSSLAYLGQFGTDYYLTDKDKFTLEATYQWSDGENITDVRYTDFLSSREIAGIADRNDTEEEISDEWEGKLSYRHEFNNKDQYLDMSIIHQIEFDEEKSIIDQNNIEGIAEEIDQRSDNIENQMLTLFQSDFVYPFGQGHKLETGINLSFRQIENTFLVETLQEDGQWEPFDFFDNQMIYTENIYAAYFIYAREWTKFSYQVGLRSEYSDITTDLVRSNEVNPRNYNNLFPSAALSYQVNEKNQWQLSYSKRISRPRFRHLLPFYGFSDNRNYWRGNPDLDPEFSHNFDLGYVHYFEKGSLLTSTYYRYKTDIIQRITFVNQDNVTEIIPVNLGTQNAFGFEISANYNLTKRWSTNGNLNAYMASTRGSYNGENLDADILTLSLRGSTKLDFGSGWEAQLSVNYMAPEATPQGRRRAFSGWDGGISKQFWNNRGKITFNVRDIFNARIWASESEGDDFYRESTFQWRVRSFNLNFNYLINQDRRRQGRRGGGPGDGGGDEGF